MRACFQAVTATPAKILGLDETGLEVGKRADMVLLHRFAPDEDSGTAYRYWSVVHAWHQPLTPLARFLRSVNPADSEPSQQRDRALRSLTE